MITRFWWVRHGPTHSHVLNGWTDVAADLSDTSAIVRLQRFLPEQAVLVSSDLSRARKTADLLAGSRLPDEADLREGNHGDWEGKSFSEISLSDPKLSREYLENPGDVAPPNGESWNAVAARVGRVVDRLNAPQTDNFVVVAHFGVILTAIQRAAAMSARAALAFEIEPLSVTRLDYLHAARTWRIGFINHVA